MLGLSYCAGAFVESGGYSVVVGQGFSLQWVLLFWSMGSRAHGLQYLWLQASRAQAQQLWCSGLVALWHLGSSWARDQTHVPCTGRWILNYWITKKAPNSLYSSQHLFLLNFYQSAFMLFYLTDLIYMPLIACEVKDFFICLSSIQISLRIASWYALFIFLLFVYL